MRSGGACGIWPGRRTLVAIILREDGTTLGPIRLARSSDAYEGLLAHLQALGVANVVLPEILARDGPLAVQAACDGRIVWLAPKLLVDSLRKAAGLPTSRARAVAAMLARLPEIPGFRQGLKRIEAPDSRQLTLL